MIKQFFILLIILIEIFSLKQIKAQNKLERLNNMFIQKDTIALLNFINDWAKESQQLARNNLIFNDTLKSIDKMFKKVYFPTNWRKIIHIESGYTFYDNIQFVIVQTKISYSNCRSYDKKYKLNDSCDEKTFTTSILILK